MTFQRTYDDVALIAAVATSSSWRGVLRELGLTATSAGTARSARRHADRLGLDYSHFTGQRRWTDAELARAVADSRTWAQVVDALGIGGGSSYPSIKGHALRLGLDTSHIGVPGPRPDSLWELKPRPEHLRHAGSLIAAAWFAMCGYEVSWPLEPYRYDLMARKGDRTERVQVKTTTQAPGGTVRLAPGDKRFVYDPDDIDSFFIIDRDLRFYFIPIRAVAGFSAITLSSYAQYVVAESPLIAPLVSANG